MREGVILSGANFVPQGNNLSTRIREKDKGKRSWQTSGETRKIRQTMCFRKTCVVSDRSALVRSARVPKCCAGLCRFSLSLPSEFQSVVWKDLPSRSVISQSCKVLCRMVSLVVL